MDGCIYLEKKNNQLYPRVKICTVSKILAEQINDILLKSGFRSTHYVEITRNPNWNNLHVISVMGDIMFKKWMNLIKPANPKHIAKFDFYTDYS